MEKTLRKWAIYGFLLGMAVSILLVSYEDTFNTSDGQITTYKPLIDYIVSILRYSIIGAFFGLLIGWRKCEGKKDEQEKEEKTTYYVEFFFAVFFIVIVLVLLLGW